MLIFKFLIRIYSSYNFISMIEEINVKWGILLKELFIEGLEEVFYKML